MSRRKRKQYIVDGIPDPVWEALQHHERQVLFAVEDCSTQRFGPAELRKRLDEIERKRIDEIERIKAELHDAGSQVL